MTAFLFGGGWAYGGTELTRAAEVCGPDTLCVDFPRICDTLSQMDVNQAPGVLVGWSLGGLIMLDWLLQAPAWKPKALILVSSCARYPASSADDSGTQPQVLRGMRAGLGKQREDILSGFFTHSAYPHELPEADRAARIASCEAITTPELAEGLGFLATLDVQERLPMLDCPLLLLHGEKDHVTPPDRSRDIHRAVPSAHCILHPHEGHELILRDPAWVNRHIMEFISSAVPDRL